MKKKDWKGTIKLWQYFSRRLLRCLPEASSAGFSLARATVFTTAGSQLISRQFI
jgi:hypothetical protein